MTKLKISIVLAATMLGITTSSISLNQFPTFEYPSPTGPLLKTVTIEHEGKNYSIEIHDEDLLNDSDEELARKFLPLIERHNAQTK